MYKNKIITCLTVVLMALVFAGILFYMSYLKKSDPEINGTFVNAFSQERVEYCL